MSKLSKANNILFAAIIVVNAYIVVAPFLPGLVYEVKSHNPSTVAKFKRETRAPAAKNEPNQITIPSMLLSEPLHEGSNTYAELEKGVWRWPHSSTPNQGGNTVFIGHRFTYTTPRGVFYQLDKVKKGDEIGVTWDNKKYLYKVFETKVVPASQVSILDPTEKPTLTLYTCTPIWWPKDRLVVTARLEKII